MGVFSDLIRGFGVAAVVYLSCVEVSHMGPPGLGVLTRRILFTFRAYISVTYCQKIHMTRTYC